MRERTAEVRELAQRLAVAEQVERRRIAQILHDDLQQILFGMRRRVSSAAILPVRSGDPGLRSALSEIDAWAQQAIDLTRRLSVELSPPIPRSEGLSDALRWLQMQMREMHGFEVDLDAPREPSVVDPNLRVLLFQVVRELLFNVKKHVGVDRASVTLSESGGQVVIQVVDRGRGYQADTIHRHGSGLDNVEERLRLLGGRTEVDSRPGMGMRVTVCAPMERQASGDGEEARR